MAIIITTDRNIYKRKYRKIFLKKATNQGVKGNSQKPHHLEKKKISKREIKNLVNEEKA